MYTPDHRDHFMHTSDFAEEGWYAIRQRASHALVHFSPPGLAEVQEEPWHHSAHWGLVPSELWETPETIEISIEAPGMLPDQFDIEVIDNVLVVRGKKTSDDIPQQSRYFLREQAFGNFEREFHLPSAINDTEAGARYRQGVLRISLPKSLVSKESRIVVESAG